MHLDIVFKTFVGILVAVVLVGSGLGVIHGFSKVVEADNYLEAVCAVITESNYNVEIIQSCKEEAAENGFELEVSVKAASKVGIKNYAMVRFTYYFDIPLFGVYQEKTQTKLI